MKRINLLHLITSLNIGGTEKYLLTIAKRQKTRYNLFVGFLKERGKMADELEREQIPVYYLGNPGRLYRFLRKENIHLLHTHLYRANILGRPIGRAAKVPIILSSQQSIDGWKRFYHFWLDGWTSRFARYIIANSQAARKVLINRERISKRKIRVIYSTIEASTLSFQANRAKVKKNIGLKDNTIIIGCIARLHPEKGVQYIPAIGQKLKRRIPHRKLLIIGDGPLRKRLENQIADLGLSENILFLGWREDVGDLLSIMDVFFLPSQEESFPRAVLEALTMGRPVVATDVGGVGEIIQDRIHGLLVPPRNPDALAQAILRMLENRKEAREMASRGRRRVETHFPLNRMLKKTEGLYRDLIQKRIGD